MNIIKNGSINKNLRIVILFFSLILSFIATHIIIVEFINDSSIYINILLFSGIASFFYFKVLPYIFCQYKVKTKKYIAIILTSCFVFSLVISLLISPMSIEQSLNNKSQNIKEPDEQVNNQSELIKYDQENEIVIEATGEKNISAKSNEVWIYSITVDGQKIQLEDLKIDENWEKKYDALVCSKSFPSRIVYKGTIRNSISIELLSHQWSGIAKVLINGKGELVDLFGEAQTQKELEYNKGNISRISSNRQSTDNRLVITALGEKNNNSRASEVWIKRINVDNKDILVDDLLINEGWENRNGTLVSYKQQPTEITYNGDIKYWINITLVAHPHSGLVSVKIGDKEKIIDLYDSSNTVRYVFFKANNILSYPLYLLELFLAFFIITQYILLLWIEQYRVSIDYDSNTIAGRRLFFYAMPCIAVFLIYFLAFYPAVMTADSMEQWKQVSNFTFTDWHPVFHTLFIWVVTRLWFSPSAVSLVQIFILSFTWAYAMYTLERDGYSIKLLSALTILFSIFPMNGIYSITLWKDIMYSISVLLLTILLFHICKDQSWLRSTKNMIFFSIIIILVSLFRHNGIVPAIGCSIAAVIVFSEARRRAVKALLLSVVVIFIIKLPIYNILNVQPADNLKMGPAVQYLAAFIANDVEFNEDEVAVLEKVTPIENWKKYYNKYYGGTLFFNETFNKEELNKNSRELTKIALGKSIDNIDLIIKQFYYLNTLAINPIQPKDAWFDGFAFKVDPNGMGLTQQSKSNELYIALMGLFRIASLRRFNWFFGIPAIYFYISTVLCLLYCKKNGYRYLLIMLPVILNTLSVMLFGISPHNTRYLYATFLVFPFVVGITLFKASQSSSEEVPRVSN